ncbi:DNA repair exonuclease [Rhizobium sp. NFR03]|uniref:metallophosphoesterase family protein n=1 Tax=Rhizobium sp. NFR03 TaxID=1566263 RepID=UPI0008C2E42A|nr:DNA repair exonuclease [Rhizobium sp. NFR03]SES11261.1 DNA repair exonuclease SbcCD nuclease subunit [Rhizobium sp. NFR03]
MAFRFVHTADLHLDSPLRSLALRNGELAEHVRGATRAALTAIVDLCIAEAVDALLIAGDLYDGSQTSMNTALFLMGEMRRLEAAGVRVFVIRGNHDNQSAIRRELTFPDNVHVFSNRAKSVKAATLADGRGVYIHGIGFDQPHAPDSLLPSFPVPQADAVNIGMLHTSLAGAPGHDLYAPCSVADLASHGFDYWALGHVHHRLVHSETPLIVMPGMPQGRDINEAGAKSVTLVTIEAGGAIHHDERRIGGAVFERAIIDLTGVTEWRELLVRVGDDLARRVTAAGAQHLILRLHLTGATSLAFRLKRDPAFLMDEVTGLANALPGCWVEKVEIDCHAPETAAAGGTDTGLDPAAELSALIHSDVLVSHGFRQQAADLMTELLGQLPRELRETFGTDEATVEALLAEIARDGSDEVLAHVRAGEGDR